MATLTVRGINEDTKARLRLRAARHGRSMEAEVRALIEEAVLPQATPTEKGLGTWLHQQLSGIEGLEIPEPDRSEPARYVDFGVNAEDRHHGGHGTTDSPRDA